MGRTCEKNGRWKICKKRTNTQKVEGKGGEEDRDCDGKTALREIWKEWEENGEQQQNIEGVGEC